MSIHNLRNSRYREVAPIRRTLPVLNLADRLKHKGVCYGEDWEPQEASCAAFVQ